MRTVAKAVLCALALVLAVIVAQADAAPQSSHTFDRWQYEPLHSDWRITQILSGNVLTNDGAQVGTVKDVIIDSSGVLKSVVVETDADLGAEPQYFRMPWQKLDINPTQGVVVVALGKAQVQALAKKNNPGFIDAHQYSARQLLNLNVSLRGAQPSATVSDLLFRSATDMLSALIVETDSLAGKRYAVPWLGSEVQLDNDAIVLPYAQQDIDTLKNYEFSPGQQLPD